MCTPAEETAGAAGSRGPAWDAAPSPGQAPHPGPQRHRAQRCLSPGPGRAGSGRPRAAHGDFWPGAIPPEPLQGRPAEEPILAPSAPSTGPPGRVPGAPGSPARAPPTAVLNDPGIKTLGFSKKTKRTVLLRYRVGGCPACTGHGAGETVASGGSPGYRTALAASARLEAAGGWLRQQAAPARLLRHLPSVPPVSPASARGRSAFPPLEAAAHPAGPAAPRRRCGLGWD